ncbi:rod shape-determining protein MreC [Blastomonas sp.]|uniref:rod shape-determining protein MreC n=1 Tax=Blastomonas sp. TaxID=1909299 RepID=UPI0035947D4B
MAPPPSQRVGFSRPAQYLLFVAYVGTVLGAVGGLILLVTAWADPAGHSQLRSRLTDLTVPVSAGGAAVLRTGGGVGQRLGDWWRAGAQNAALRQELEEARIQMVDVGAVRAENQRLKRLLKVAERTGSPIAVTRVVASSPAALRRLAVLPVGRSSGVRPNQTVRGARGLVGRVIEAGAISARILLVTDTASVVPVRRATDTLSAVAVGDGAGGVEIRSLANRRVRLNPGDLFVTSGIGGVFPPGIPVAIVRQTASDQAAARPLGNPDLSDHVMVLPVFEPRVATPPPAPIPASSSAEQPPGA